MPKGNVGSMISQVVFFFVAVYKELKKEKKWHEKKMANPKDSLSFT